MLFTIAIVVTTVIAACGGDNHESSSVSSISKTEFIEQANAACRQVRVGLAKRVSEFEQNRAGDKTEPYSDAVHFIYLPTLEAQIWQIGKLDIPHGQVGRIEVMLDAEKDAIDAVAVMPRVSSVAVASQHFGKADNLFRAYGLTSCAT